MCDFWKNSLMGMLFFLAVPLCSYAMGDSIRVADGIVQKISVHRDSGNKYGIYTVINNHRYFLFYDFDSLHQHDILSLLVYAKGSGNRVTLWNHRTQDSTWFDEVLLED